MELFGLGVIKLTSTMYKLEKEIKFEAAHVLPNHDGKCGRLHGHSWRAMIILESQTLHTEGPKAGMVFDFGDVSKAAKPLLDDALDHHYLNETTGLENPTSEALARFIFDKLKSSLPLLAAVRVFETCTSSCEYRP